MIKWLQEASVSAVSRLVGVSWSAIDRIMQRAVQRGLARRADLEVAHNGVDETSFRKRHDYVMIVSDSTTGTVLHVGEDRNKTSLFGWYDHLTNAQLVQIKLASMDLWPAYISATLAHAPHADRRVAFDRFHLANCLGAAVDKVRRPEHKALMKDGRDEFKSTRFDWLTNPASRSHKQKLLFKQLRDSSLKTARAYAIKESVRKLWHDVQPTWALKGWKRWLSWAMRCWLEPVKVAQTIKNHLWGILNAVILKVSNGPAESINSRIKTVKVRSRGFRNKQRFANAIYFHLGGLDLYPDGVRA